MGRSSEDVWEARRGVYKGQEGYVGVGDGEEEEQGEPMKEKAD